MSKRINTYAKGYRHEKKTVDWLRSNGYFAERVRVCGRPQDGAQDVWGADIIARDYERILFIQVKANRGHIAKGARQLSTDDMWPSIVERWVVHWPRAAKEPEVRVV